ncbi:MAG: SusD/RagB family nutrient-binding outer membrane lipoprotein [Cyclobacteriaceae bacterium]
MMKKYNVKVWAGAVAILFLAASCSDFLDINDNPNAATSADVNLVLPQAITASAVVANTYNTYGGHFGGFLANAGGFSGFGTLLSYNLTPSDHNGLWTVTYQDPLNDFKYVIDKTEGDPTYAYFNAAAKIMTVYLYMKLVDTFGDVPYTEALRGSEGLVTPAYDDAASIYADLQTKLDEAISLIDNSQFSLRLTKASDPLFGPLAQSSAERNIGDQMLDWKRFANTLKLKMLVRTANNAGLAALPLTFPDIYVTPGDASTGVRIPGGSAFITDDAIVDPGFEVNRPNPAWNSWGRTVALTLSNSSRVPTSYSFAFYAGPKLSDAGRGRTIYVNYPATPHNQLGDETDAAPIVANQVTWAGSGIYSGLGVLKGAGMGQPLMLAAEALFLRAEAELNGGIAGGTAAAETSFNAGITASFNYLYKDENETVTTAVAPLVSSYISTNTGNYLADFTAATTTAQRLEAIITQKYIAMNMITSDEAYNEFRRTGFPVTVPGGGENFDIASNKSTITERFDRLPTRVMYPSSEQSFNAGNYRTVDYRSERIFWDPS